MDAVTQKLTNFSINRSLSFSDGLMFSASHSAPDDRRTVKIEEVTVTGPRSEYSTTEAQAAQPNPQKIERANLDADHDLLTIDWNATIYPVSAANINVCNVPAFEQIVDGFLTEYAEKGGFGVLARLHAYRFADGSTAWRNRYGKTPTVDIEIEADAQPPETFSFDAKAIRSLDPWAVARGEGLPDDLARLADRIESALVGRTEILHAKVHFSVRMAPGQEVYPSQEMVTNTAPGVGRILSKYGDTNQATIHAQKISSAVRSVDIWHPHFNEVGPISAEVFGSSRRHVQAFRYGRQYSFFGRIERLKQGRTSPVMEAVNGAESLNTPDIGEDIHYIVAMIARGGVFSEGKSEKNESRTARAKKQTEEGETDE